MLAPHANVLWFLLRQEFVAHAAGYLSVLRR
jgi:hypothetical protein